MSRKLLIFAISAAFVAFGALRFTGGSSVAAQSTMTGEWTASVDNDKSNRINLKFQRRTDKGSKNHMGHTFELSDFQGLSREQVVNGGPVRFSLVREAGTIELEGSFQNGKGSGTYRFSGNQSFVSAMKSRGFDFEEQSKFHDEDDRENRLFAATTLNVTTALADDLVSAGFGKLHVDDLFKAAIFKIDSAFMREMKDTGYPGLTMEDLVKARIFKVDANFVREVSQMGFEKEGFESLVKLRIFKVTPEFISEVRNEGLTNLSIEDAVKMRIFKIDAEFIRQAKAEGVPLDVERLVQKKIGVHARVQ
ncbi:MAG TPA: hypothetical protein VJM12_18880 [Pyrinomonadaceae bacterium]|nr:hypothetical protein [Pyrinomonadaceae bacterium]